MYYKERGNDMVIKISPQMLFDVPFYYSKRNQLTWSEIMKFWEYVEKRFRKENPKEKLEYRINNQKAVGPKLGYQYRYNIFFLNKKRSKMNNIPDLIKKEIPELSTIIVEGAKVLEIQ